MTIDQLKARLVELQEKVVYHGTIAFCADVKGDKATAFNHMELHDEYLEMYHQVQDAIWDMEEE